MKTFLKGGRLRKIFLLLMITALTGAFGQRLQYGKIRGTVVDKDTNEPVIDANVYLTSAKEEKNIGTATDEKGEYIINYIPFGDYALISECIGYKKVVIKDFKVFYADYRDVDITMEQDVIALSELSVSVEAIKTAKEMQLTKRQMEVKIVDAISAEEMSSYGSSDAASAMKHVTGASVEGGKYVYVRGLGNRYSTVHLNGIELPSADPDENSFQLDLVSSSVMDDIATSKIIYAGQARKLCGRTY